MGSAFVQQEQEQQRHEKAMRKIGVLIPVGPQKQGQGDYKRRQ